MTARKSTAEVLRDAARLIQECGWRQGMAPADTTWTGPLCVAEALGAATSLGAHGSYLRARRAVLSAVGSYGHLIDWNDASGRTVDEVIAALTTAAESVSGEKA